MNTVRYRVHCVIFFLPSSSFCILPIDGAIAAGQLEDDRGRDVGHDPEREHRGPGEPAAQRVVQAEEAGGGGVPDEVGQRGDVDARRRDVGADPVDHQSREGEEQLPLQLVVDGQIGNAGCGHYPSMLPPAASIFARADADKATPRTV